MTAVNKIDSNETSLRIALETTIGVLPGSPVWNAFEPNSYPDFGGDLTLVARRPINANRQRKKGVITDLDASGGFETDVTYSNLQDILQGFLFANLRTKDEKDCTTISGGTPAYQVTAGTDYVANDLIFAKYFDLAANNGLKVVTASASGSVTAASIVNATSQTGVLSRVGFEFAAGDVSITNSGSAYPTMTSVVKDFTAFDIVPGEWIFIGGDTSGTKFATAANNTWARVKSVAAHTITFDKTRTTMVTDTGATKTVRIFFGRVLKNESDTSLIVRKTYQLERTLGAPDTGSTDVQAQYLPGSVPSELELVINTADKMTANLSFMSINDEQQEAGPLKTGTRPTLRESDAFNTSSDIKRFKLSIISTTDAAPTPLFAFVTDLSMSFNNNISPNKAVGVLGAFDMTAGTFDLSASLTAYFSDVAAVAAVRNNSDVTLDCLMYKDNAGWAIDMPLIALGGGKPEVSIDNPITLPIEADAAAGAAYDTNMDHTVLFTFFDYLPDLAATSYIGT